MTIAIDHPLPIRTLSLSKEVLLDRPTQRLCFNSIHLIARLMPALVVYGGTLYLLLCLIAHLRGSMDKSGPWKVLVVLYITHMFINTLLIMIFHPVGIFLCWLSGQKDWYKLYCNGLDGCNSEECMVQPQIEEVACLTRGVLEWHDVFHVVIIPTYKTPMSVLENSIAALACYSERRNKMGLCLAFEEHEEEAAAKAIRLKMKYSNEFCFVMSSLHPSNLESHMRGKSSNECWAYFEVLHELDKHGYHASDPRVIVTIMDDDTEMHENYFEALTYHFVEADEVNRYLTIWQPPIGHFKNYATQPLLVRCATHFVALIELSQLANPMARNVPFSSYSLSLALASAVGGWDPDYISEDWHMMAKCCLMTEGRARCVPIFLPIVNYAPEEETWRGTLRARWAQANRHALGVGEVVYLCSHMYLVFLEIPTIGRRIVSFWRMLPLLLRFIQVHFTVATVGVWPALMLIFYMSDSGVDRKTGTFNSWILPDVGVMANVALVCSPLLTGFGALSFQLVKERCLGDIKGKMCMSNPVTHWIRAVLETIICGHFASIVFCAAPEWYAVIRIITASRFDHDITSMVGRPKDDHKFVGGDAIVNEETAGLSDDFAVRVFNCDARINNIECR